MYLFVYPSPIHQSVHISVSPSPIYPTVYLSTYPSITHPPIHPTVHPSIHPYNCSLLCSLNPTVIATLPVFQLMVFGVNNDSWIKSSDFPLSGGSCCLHMQTVARAIPELMPQPTLFASHSGMTWIR